MKVLSQLHEPLVVLLVLCVGAYQLRQTGHDGSDCLPGVLIRLLRVEGVILQGPIFLLEAPVSSVLSGRKVSRAGPENNFTFIQ